MSKHEAPMHMSWKWTAGYLVVVSTGELVLFVVQTVRGWR